MMEALLQIPFLLANGLLTHKTKTMKNRVINNWWLLSILGVGFIALGIWVYKNPLENYLALSVLFSTMIFVSGIFEIIFALTNIQSIKGWGWPLSAGIFDLIIGAVLLNNPDLSMMVLPIIFGIWLTFRGIVQISRGFLLKELGFYGWLWPVVGGIFIIIFGSLVLFNPAFGSITIVAWTALALIFLGVFTFSFSFIVRKLQHLLDL